MPHTIPVRGYTRRRNVPEKMRSLLGRLGFGQNVTVDSHDRKYTNRRNITCSFCLEKFSSRGEMEEHIRTGHGPGAMVKYLQKYRKKGGK